VSSVLLISTNIFANPYPVYPLGMAVIASALSARGHTVRQFDSKVEDQVEDRLAKELVEFSPDFVGISIRNIDNVDSLSPDGAWTLSREKRIVSLVRQHTDAPVIAGGSGFSAMPEEIFDFIQADYGVVGEGERIICDLIDNLNSGNPVPRILPRADTPLMGNEMCSPLWEKSFIDFYLKQSGTVNLQTKRGCPHNCSYCVYPALEGRKFRFREPGAVIDDLEQMQRRFDVKTVFFTDSVFNDSEGHYLEVAEGIISSGLKIRWAGYFRPKGIGLKELTLLKRSGLYAMEVGTDAGCDETLDNLKKGFHFEDVIEFNRASIEAEIPSAHFFIFGGPGETEKTLNEGLKNIALLKKSVIFVYSGARILPGTDLYRRALREGLIAEKASLLNPVYYFSPNIDIEFMNRTIEKEAAGRREFIFPPDKAQMMIDAMNMLGYKGLLWDMLVSFSNDTGRRKRKI
jgi:lipid biosynthesis B12-binding/radical SAM protein